MENEIEFTPETMTLANGADLFRMWRRLWGNMTPDEVQEAYLAFQHFGADIRDQTQD